MKKGLEMIEEIEDDVQFVVIPESEETEELRKWREKQTRALTSPQAWTAGWRERTFDNARFNLSRQYDNSEPVKYFEGWRWIEGKEIKIFTDGNVDERAVEPVIMGINELIDDLGLDLRVRYFPKLASHPSVTKPIRLSTKGDFIDAQKIGRYFMAETWRQPPYKQHADVLITNKPLLVGGENFGQCEFSLGYMLISLTDGTNNPKDDRNRQRPGMYDLVRRIAKHETGHLLGYQMHHEQTKVAGYAEPKDCAMYWRASTDVFCDKCKDALLGFWEGLEKETGKKFLK